MRAKIDIPRVTPSLNQWQRLHWRRRSALRRRFGEDLLVAMQARRRLERHRLARLKKTESPLRVTIVRHGKRLLDPDNLVGGAKPLIDAMRDLGLIVDDDPAHLELTVKQQKAKEPKMLVLIETEENE